MKKNLINLELEKFYIGNYWSSERYAFTSLSFFFFIFAFSTYFFFILYLFPLSKSSNLNSVIFKTILPSLLLYSFVMLFLRSTKKVWIVVKQIPTSAIYFQTTIAILVEIIYISLLGLLNFIQGYSDHYMEFIGAQISFFISIHSLSVFISFLLLNHNVIFLKTNESLLVKTYERMLIFPFLIINRREFSGREISLELLQIKNVTNSLRNLSHTKQSHFLSYEEFLKLPDNAKTALLISDQLNEKNEIKRGDVIRHSTKKSEIIRILNNIRILGAFKILVPPDFNIEMSTLDGSFKKL